MAFAHAYFDESYWDDPNGVMQMMCVAGYVFTKENAIALEPEWRSMLATYGLPYFRMSECANGNGAFKSLSPERRDLAAREAIALIKRYASKGIALTMDADAWPGIGVDGVWSSPYSFLCGNVMFGVRNWADASQFQGGISYFYESGGKGWGAAQSDISRVLVGKPLHKSEFRHFAHVTIDKKDSGALQCADILAWHFLKNAKRERAGQGKRKDFKSLIELRVDPHHFDAIAVARWRETWAAIRRQLDGPDRSAFGELLHSPVQLLLAASS